MTAALELRDIHHDFSGLRVEVRHDVVPAFAAD